MNQNNNYNFDPMTGQPVKQSEQAVSYNQEQRSIQQSVQNKHPKNNNVLIILSFLVIVGIVAAILYFTNQNKNESANNVTNNNLEVENNEQQVNDSTGTVEDGTNTIYDENGAFLYSITDVFTITGRGTVVTGKVERGKVKIGDTVQIVGLDKEILTTEVTGLEMFRHDLEEAMIGDNVGIFLKDITREQVKVGQVLAKPNSITSIKKFDADISILSEEEGGKRTPFLDGFKPKFHFRGIGITGATDLRNGLENVKSGENVSVTVTLESAVAMEVGTEFSISEDGIIIGKGTVSKIY